MLRTSISLVLIKFVSRFVARIYALWQLPPSRFNRARNSFDALRWTASAIDEIDRSRHTSNKVNSCRTTLRVVRRVLSEPFRVSEGWSCLPRKCFILRGEGKTTSKPRDPDYNLIKIFGQATKGLCTDDLVRWGDEGRGKHRYASGSRKLALIRGIPNGATHHGLYRGISALNS